MQVINEQTNSMIDNLHVVNQILERNGYNPAKLIPILQQIRSNCCPSAHRQTEKSHRQKFDPDTVCAVPSSDGKSSAVLPEQGTVQTRAADSRRTRRSRTWGKAPRWR